MVAQKRKKRSNGHWKIILAIAAVVAVISAVIAVASFGWEERYSAEYFVSDESKLVMPLGKDIALYEDSDYEPEVTYVVYYYDGGDYIKNTRVFFAYDNKEDAAEANENIVMEGKDWAASKKLSGNYIVFDLKKEQYEDIRTEYIRDIIEKMKEAGTIYEPEEAQEESEAEEDVIFDNDNTE